VITGEQLTRLIDSGASPEQLKVFASILSEIVEKNLYQISTKSLHVDSTISTKSLYQRRWRESKKHTELSRKISTSVENGRDLVEICVENVKKEKVYIDPACVPVEDKPFLLTMEESKKVRKEDPPTPLLREVDFDKFWILFPRQRRGNREKVYKTFQRAIARASPEEIIAATERYAASDEVQRGYAKGAEAWLNDDRWTFDYTVQPEKINGEKSKNQKFYGRDVKPTAITL
jgi:hypothetical protein